MSTTTNQVLTGNSMNAATQKRWEAHIDSAIKSGHYKGAKFTKTTLVKGKPVEVEYHYISDIKFGPVDGMMQQYALSIDYSPTDWRLGQPKVKQITSAMSYEAL